MLSYGGQFGMIPELLFLETSALTGENVEEAFLKCARSILTKIESGQSVNNNTNTKILFVLEIYGK